VAGDVYLKADEEATSGNDGAADDVGCIAATQAGGDDDSESTIAAQSIETNEEDKAEDIIDTFMKETAVERTLNARSRLVRDFNAKAKKKMAEISPGDGIACPIGNETSSLPSNEERENTATTRSRRRRERIKQRN